MNIIDLFFLGYSNPFNYSALFFIYSVLAAVILPTPVEFGLFNPYVNPIILILILAMGKGIGSILVFYIGIDIRSWIKKYKIHWISKGIINKCEKFVTRYGSVGLFIILSIPFMIDTLSLYLFSLLNSKKNGKRAISINEFFLINLFAGVVRGSIIILAFYAFGLKLV